MKHYAVVNVQNGSSDHALVVKLRIKKKSGKIIAVKAVSDKLTTIAEATREANGLNGTCKPRKTAAASA